VIVSVLITGAGRGGTNLATEVVRCSDVFTFTQNVEDRGFFQLENIPISYGTKLATENPHFTRENVSRMLNEVSHLSILFVVRHPIDNCLSKMYRGRPISQGGDGVSKNGSADSTKETSIDAIHRMFNIFCFVQENYPNRVHWFKMEQLLLCPRETIEVICNFLKIQFQDKMLRFYKNNRNKYQQGRYGTELDKSQVDLYKDLSKSFNGYFSEQPKIILEIWARTKSISTYFGYRL
jgi:hypothetical protein